jgi:hypothetical protein
VKRAALALLLLMLTIIASDTAQLPGAFDKPLAQRLVEDR